MKYLTELIIDTDPGHDDALAIMLAVRSGKFNIHMISTVAGNSTIENTTRNAHHILKILGREDIPIYSGSSSPLRRKLVQAVVHGKGGLAGIYQKGKPNLTGDAVERMIDAIKKSKSMTLVAIGPLTNVAKAIEKDPKTMAKLKQIVIMGGAINVSGNMKTGEFNFFVDPEAANAVLDFNVKKTLIPLDVCNKAVINEKEFEKLKKSNLYVPIMAMMKSYIKGIKEDTGIDGAIMYDPLTIYALCNPKAFIRKKMGLRVGIRKTNRGKCLLTKKDDIDVAIDLDAKKFKEDFFQALLSSTK